MSDKHCKNLGTGVRSYGIFNNFIEAKEICSNDEQCKGVLDWGCDGISSFNLCYIGNRYESETSFDSCIYDKQGNDNTIKISLLS